ncbi:unnamed protein product [Larinioides sclopetarius]|uniref:Ig-like domain-containing protein n=1 Tax=Larinioides sclopetarius TaxID=280406 RepID=A0AAV1ZG50_9ARAC
MEFSVDYSLNSWNWNRRYYLISRAFVCFWLLMTYNSGVTAKQINAAKIPMKPPIYPKPSYSFSKSSGLSIVQPAALLNGKQFVVEPVSWLRLRDFHLLTVGLYTYTSDTRFQTIYNEYATDWTLQIRYPQLSDEGLYECQVSSDPPISHYVFLKVIVPKTKILGSGNFYVSVGSEINLTCVITDCPEPPAYVFWYHDSRMINFDPGRINIALQKAGNNTAISRLRIKNAEASDTGNYSCSPSNADVASIFVHVLKGEKHAAVQNDAASTSSSSRFVSSFNTMVAFQFVVLFTVTASRSR